GRYGSVGSDLHRHLDGPDRTGKPLRVPEGLCHSVPVRTGAPFRAGHPARVRLHHRRRDIRLTQLRDYVYLGLTQSLCPTCLKLVPAKIIAKQDRVYFRKTCPEHGTIEDFVCSDVQAYDRHDLDEPATRPLSIATESQKSC